MPKEPLIFILSPGVDPTKQVSDVANERGIDFQNCALGQGQEPVAVGMIEAGLVQGNWVFLANCHLMVAWLPALEKIVGDYCLGTPHAQYRLWLSASPTPAFPMGLLQRGECEAPPVPFLPAATA